MIKSYFNVFVESSELLHNHTHVSDSPYCSANVNIWRHALYNIRTGSKRYAIIDTFHLYLPSPGQARQIRHYGSLFYCRLQCDNWARAKNLSTFTLTLVKFFDTMVCVQSTQTTSRL